MNREIRLQLGIMLVMTIVVVTMILTLTDLNSSGVHASAQNLDGMDNPSDTVRIAETASETAASVADVMVSQDPTTPGANAEYQIQFDITDSADSVLVAEVDSIRFNFDRSIGVPGSIAKENVLISSTKITGGGEANQAVNPAVDPVHSIVPNSGRDYYTVAVPDMDPDEERVGSIDRGATVTVIFSPGAGLTNPTEAGTDDVQVWTSKHQTETTKVDNPGSLITTPLVIFLDDTADNRNTPLTVLGRGFKNGTTAIVYLDRNDDGDRGDDDVDLVSIVVASDDTFEATFRVTVPPFEPGPDNVIRARDVKTQDSADGVSFEVEGLMTISPRAASIGNTIQVTLLDWPQDPIDTEIDLDSGTGALKIADTPQQILGEPSISADGSASFEVELGGAVDPGTHEVSFATENESDYAIIQIVETPPIAPVNFAAAQTGGGRVTLSWDDPEDTTITEYEYTDDSGSTWKDITGSGARTVSYVVRKLTVGSRYTFAVRAANDGGNGAPSAWVSLTVVGKPERATGLTASSGNGVVNLSWDDPGNPDITGWQYWVREHVGDKTILRRWEPVPGSGHRTTSATVTGLTIGEPYRFRVRALSAAGAGRSSNVVKATP